MPLFTGLFRATKYGRKVLIFLQMCIVDQTKEGNIQREKLAEPGSHLL